MSNLFLKGDLRVAVLPLGSQRAAMQKLHYSPLTPKGEINPQWQGYENVQSLFKGRFAGGGSPFRKSEGSDAKKGQRCKRMHYSPLTPKGEINPQRQG